MKLSILDQSPVGSGSSPAEALRDTVALSRAADELGYHRFWLAEHHGSPSFAGTTPILLAMRVLDATERISVGTGGVLLGLHRVRDVSEAFELLAALHPGRVDLGLGRAGTSDPEIFNDRLARLHLDLRMMPDDDARSDLRIWLLGAGRTTSPLAAAFGSGYAHAHFLDPTSGKSAILRYVSTFAPTNHRPHPEALVAVRVITAATTDEAQHLAQSVRLWGARKDLGVDLPFPRYSDSAQDKWSDQELSLNASNEARLIVGDPVSVVMNLKRISRQMGVDELMINTPLPVLTDRVRSYRLLANAMSEVFTADAIHT